MATERVSHSDDGAPYPYELSNEPVADDLPPITREDVTRVIAKIEAGRATDSYRFGPDDFDVFMYLTQGQWRAAQCDPSSLMDALAPYVRA
jgi:hypothetical protein